MIEMQTIKIEAVLEWSDWHTWNKVKQSYEETGAGICPPDSSGVYEVRCAGEEMRLTIGMSGSFAKQTLKGRIRKFVVGTGEHSTRDRIKKDLGETGMQRLVLRWATTDWPAAVEEYLKHEHYKRFGGLPRYTKR